jgi:hypothetical protein
MTATDIPVAEPLRRLTRDLRDAAATLGRDEARFLVDIYYQMQESRKALANQERSLARSNPCPQCSAIPGKACVDSQGQVIRKAVHTERLQEPHLAISFFYGQFDMLEKQIVQALDAYSNSEKLGVWARSNVGIGPVLAAGLLAHIDISRAPTAGRIWRFAGLDPSIKWEKGQKRPYNADLKVLCWKIADSFKKQSGREGCFYGQLYLQRKEFELKRDEQVGPPIPRDTLTKSQLGAIIHEQGGVLINDSVLVGGNAQAAAASLRERNITDGDLIKIYKSGHLPAGRLDLRAMRWAVKLFLAHYQEVGYTIETGSPPVDPYPLAYLGHADRITPPNWP